MEIGGYHGVPRHVEYKCMGPRVCVGTSVGVKLRLLREVKAPDGTSVDRGGPVSRCVVVCKCMDLCV